MDHPILCFALSDLCPDYGHFFLWDTNRLVALGAKVATHADPSIRGVFLARIRGPSVVVESVHESLVEPGALIGSSLP